MPSPASKPACADTLPDAEPYVHSSCLYRKIAYDALFADDASATWNVFSWPALHEYAPTRSHVATMTCVAVKDDAKGA